jgi:hypothetical protein
MNNFSVEKKVSSQTSRWKKHKLLAGGGYRKIIFVQVNESGKLLGPMEKRLSLLQDTKIFEPGKTMKQNYKK